jgi:hypothetical protein
MRLYLYFRSPGWAESKRDAIGLNNLFLQKRRKYHMKHVLTIALILTVSYMTGCASVDQRVNLAYEKVVDSKGGSGELLIAKPVEQHNAFKKPSGELVIGKIKDTDREIITTDSISEWLMLAFVQELYTAGYNVKTVSELPADVIKGIKITISEIKAAQVFGTLIVKTESGIKLSVEVWKNGKYVRTLNIEGDHEEKGVNRSAEPVSTLLQKNLQNLMQKLVPDIIKTMEES